MLSCCNGEHVDIMTVVSTLCLRIYVMTILYNITNTINILESGDERYSTIAVQRCLLF